MTGDCINPSQQSSYKYLSESWNNWLLQGHTPQSRKECDWGAINRSESMQCRWQDKPSFPQQKILAWCRGILYWGAWRANVSIEIKQRRPTCCLLQEDQLPPIGVATPATGWVILSIHNRFGYKLKSHSKPSATKPDNAPTTKHTSLGRGGALGTRR